MKTNEADRVPQRQGEATMKPTGDSQMKMRKVCSAVVFLAVMTATVTAARGSMLHIDSYDKTAAGPFDLTILGGTDWAVPFVDQKAGGTAIQIYTPDSSTPWWIPQVALQAGSYYNAPGPNLTFAYTDGERGASTGVSCVEDYAMPSMTSTIDLAAGSGVITAWFWTWNAGGEFTATFGDTTSVAHITSGAAGGPDKVVISYSTAAAQTLVLKADGTNAGGGASFMGVAVVPEPAALGLLALGVLGVLRRRR